MAKQRDTPQRRAVRAGLAGAQEFISAQSLYERLRSGGERIGLATVYRSLAALAEGGDADVMQSPDGEMLYRACASSGHHHHLICRSCGTTRELSAAVIEEWTGRVGREYGFSQVQHVVDLFGLCASCAKARGK